MAHLWACLTCCCHYSTQLDSCQIPLLYTAVICGAKQILQYADLYSALVCGALQTYRNLWSPSPSRFTTLQICRDLFLEDLHICRYLQICAPRDLHCCRKVMIYTFRTCTDPLIQGQCRSPTMQVCKGLFDKALCKFAMLAICASLGPGISTVFHNCRTKPTPLINRRPSKQEQDTAVCHAIQQEQQLWVRR